MKINKSIVFLVLILLISLFFRVYQTDTRFQYDHDNDLSGWIVKDIVVNHHPRLIGQLTSAEGIFIGPLYYYTLATFYLFTNMDPIGGVILLTILGVLTTFSYYWVFTKLFEKKVGLIAAFFQAVSLSSIFFDRRVVPSTPTNLWMVWYFYVVIQLTRGNFYVLPILGILIGLIWHIHIALAPALLAVPVAIFIAKKLPTFKQILLSLAALFITSLPLIVFEIKNHFIQTTSFINNFSVNHGGGTGLEKLNLLLIKMAGNFWRLFLSPIDLPTFDQRIIILLILLVFIFVVFKKILSFKESIPLFVWILGVVIFYTVSSSLVSEYYLANIEIIYIAVVSLILVSLWKIKKIGRVLVFIVVSLFLAKTIFFFQTDIPYQKGYTVRKQVVDYLKNEMQKNDYPCIAVSYITSPGENVGFRYFFWLNKMPINNPTSFSGPIYSIAIPDEMALGSVKQKFGHIGIVPPEKIPSKVEMQKACAGKNDNLTSSMFGYVE